MRTTIHMHLADDEWDVEALAEPGEAPYGVLRSGRFRIFGDAEDLENLWHALDAVLREMDEARRDEEDRGWLRGRRQ